VELSKEVRKMLQRLLEKDTDLRFKKASDIFAHPWLKDVQVADVLAKKLDPPFKTNLFENNFDSSDFAHDEQGEILKLTKEKERGKLTAEEICFPNFMYLHPELQKVEAEADRMNEQRLDFTKKPTPSVL
jgi:hypothetical protein